MIPASIIPTVSDKVRRALDFALTNIGVCEDPPGSNRSPEIDAWARELGSPLGSFWCAIAVAKARKEGGLWIPHFMAGACNEWVAEASRAGLVIGEPVAGAAVVYIDHTRILDGRYAGQLEAVHIGLVLRVTPVLMAIEGNTTLGRFDRNGYVQTLKEVDRSRVLCYIAPEYSARGVLAQVVDESGRCRLRCWARRVVVVGALGAAGFVGRALARR